MPLLPLALRHSCGPIRVGPFVWAHTYDVAQSINSSLGLLLIHSFYLISVYTPRSLDHQDGNCHCLRHACLDLHATRSDCARREGGHLRARHRQVSSDACIPEAAREDSPGRFSGHRASWHGARRIERSLHA